MAIPTTTQSGSASIIDLVGDTPLIRLRRIERDLPGVELYAKAEWQNPGGSVKDRPALRMVQEGIASGRLVPGRTILDATSGNTGIAYAMIGAALGFRVTLCVPENVTPERKRILRAYGAELIFTNPLEGSDGAIRTAQQMNEHSPERFFYADQYNNDFNWKSHYDTTGPEIIRQAGSRLTHFVAGLGTSGTFVGTGRRLREFKPGIVLASVQPDSPLHGLEGLKHMESAIVPGIYDRSLADEDVRVGTEEAYDMTRRLAQEEGLLVGISSGANLAGALKVARPDAVMVVVFCDGGERYLSERFWENPPEGASIRSRQLRDRWHELMEAIRLQPAVDAAIRAHGRETFPHECCGALLGRDGVVQEAHALANTTAEGPRRRFLVRPDDYRGAEQRARETGLDLLGFYHSHPDHPARPSQYDLDHAWPSFSYVIVSIMAGEDRLLTSWRLKEDRSAFDEEPVEITNPRDQQITKS